HQRAQVVDDRLERARLDPALGLLVDGLITNDRSCLTRRCEHSLNLRRARTYAPEILAGRGSSRESDVEGAAHDADAPRRAASVGPSLPAPPGLGERSSRAGANRGDRCG